MEKIVPINEEYIYEGSAIVIQTDLDGIITYTNNMFSIVSGYKASELIGINQDVIRHPDMPDTIFSKITEATNSGKVWKGLIKNLRKDGLYYWVDIEILPIMEDGKVVGLISAARNASEKEIKENSEKYQKMLEAQG